MPVLLKVKRLLTDSNYHSRDIFERSYYNFVYDLYWHCGFGSAPRLFSLSRFSFGIIMVKVNYFPDEIIEYVAQLSTN